MNGIFLALYALVNGGMVLFYFAKKKSIYEFPFWFGMISMAWFFPQALIGYSFPDYYPGTTYSHGMLFATLCSLALWIGYDKGSKKVVDPADEHSWLSAEFDTEKLIKVGMFLCAAGFFFHWKLMSLPEEMLKSTQWSGATVKYLFLSSLFKSGFLILWITYLKQRNYFTVNLLLFIIPSLMLMLETAFLKGRRAGMMDLFAYIFIGLWFTRRIMLPRIALIIGVLVGITLINAIGIYRTIMKNDALTVSERFEMAAKTDYSQDEVARDAKACQEFNNYIFFRQVVAEDSTYNWGLVHWNLAVFNYVPGQWVGRAFKNSLMVRQDWTYRGKARQRYGHQYHNGGGTTDTGFFDAFQSFSWFGFIKFLGIGWIMSALYRHAMAGNMLGMLLYILSVSSGMHAVSHGTHPVLVSQWIYFLALAYPPMLWAKRPSPRMNALGS